VMCVSVPMDKRFIFCFERQISFEGGDVHSFIFKGIILFWSNSRLTAKLQSWCRDFCAFPPPFQVPLKLFYINVLCVSKTRDQHWYHAPGFIWISPISSIFSSRGQSKPPQWALSSSFLSLWSVTVSQSSSFLRSWEFWGKSLSVG
jgi:hypothetical protein